MTNDERIQIYNSFQEQFPIEKLSEMTLDGYTDLERNNAFCYWLESKTETLGSFWGGSAYKFGIYRYNNRPALGDPRIVSDDKYAWYARLGASTPETAFEKIRAVIVHIAQSARKGDFEAIDEVEELGNSYKWKIAFLYSNLNLLPIYKPQYVKSAAEIIGIKVKKGMKISALQRALMGKKGLQDFFEYYDFLINKVKAIEEAKAPRLWLYSPGEDASMWDDCQKNGIMSIGWNEIGDLNQFETKEDLEAAYDEAYSDTGTSGSNSKLCLWVFCRDLRVGDIVYAKKGLSKIIGRGIVESEYNFDPERNAYRHTRKVKWTHIGEWDSIEYLNQQLPMKTLTQMSKYPGWHQRCEDAILKGIKRPKDEQVVTVEESDDEPRYWWLVANPKYWTFSDLQEGDDVTYTVKNDNGNKRRVPINFEQAKAGDIVIGYEANPVKAIVALAKVGKASDGETITFVKTETLGTSIHWNDFKDLPELANMEFIKNHNGSFFKLSKEEFDFLMELIRQENPDEDDPLLRQPEFEPYDKSSFLSEVFMSDEDFERLKSIVRLKKNVILQGAPGVGKTFSAKRLAYVLMGQKDESRVKLVQFHQNFSYEDFIMGYKPTDSGFILKTGVFYDFCKKAERDPDHDYYFIIDEINRGNLSKIFGELLMLIENGYRGTTVELAYKKDEKFAVPANLYIIGMMNTADRSLAMIDYALRRRFSFFAMRPGLDTDGFKTEISKHSDERVAKVVEVVRQLNSDIAKDDSLGEGFCIGHSYFCADSDDSDWIENVVRYDICPMLEEYWFDNKDMRQKQINRLLDAIKK